MPVCYVSVANCSTGKNALATYMSRSQELLLEDIYSVAILPSHYAQSRKPK